MFIWHEKSPSLKRANWLIRRQLFIIDYILTETGLAVVTDEGEVFVCTVSNKTSTPLKECAQHNSKGKLLCPNISDCVFFICQSKLVNSHIGGSPFLKDFSDNFSNFLIVLNLIVL